MKKFNLAILTLTVFLLINIQQISARPIFEGEAEINNYFSYKIQTDISFIFTNNLTDSSPDFTLTGKSHANIYNLDIKHLQNIVRVEFETKMDIEEWMLDVKDDFWVIDKEEPLKMEYWMLDPCDWLCQN